MSKSYFIPVILKIHLTASDLDKNGKMRIRFDVLDILPPERMKEILADALKKKGWEPKDNVCELVAPNGVKIRIDPAALQLEVDITTTIAKGLYVSIVSDMKTPIKEVELGKLETLGLASNESEQVQRQLGAMAHNISDNLIREMLKGKQLLNEVLKDVYRQAIAEKAKSLGNVTSVSESSEDGKLRIRVEIS